MSQSRAHCAFLALLAALEMTALLAGCGTTKSYVATEQLLLSDAVDATLDELDFTPLSGHKVFVDTSHISTVRPASGLGLISSEYLICTVREKLLFAGCQLATNRDDADLIAEVRVGALAADSHAVMVGVPALNASSGSLLAGHTSLPALPELSIARRETMSGKAKVGVFAYRRESREAVWQSGLAQSTSHANDTWVMGIGPMRKGSNVEVPATEPVQVVDVIRPTVQSAQAKHRTPALVR